MRDETIPTFLLTNDDGWDAPGLEALHAAAASLGPCRIVAPRGPYSGCGHRVTTHEPIAVCRGPEGQHIVDGTPADCVRLALHHLAPDARWLLSGINPGGNLGTDVYHSGTVAAVREGVLHGMPGIAISRLVHALEDARLVTLTDDEHLLPARDLGKISIQEIIDISRNEKSGQVGWRNLTIPAVDAISKTMDAAWRKSCGDMSLRDLIEEA